MTVTQLAYRMACRLFQSRRERDLPFEIRMRLNKLLHGRALNVFLVGLSGVLCGVIVNLRAHAKLPLAIACLGFVVVLVRCVLIWRFNRRPAGRELVDPERALVGFGVLATASSFCWGMLSFWCLAFSRDPVLYMISVIVVVAAAGAIAARNAAAPRVAKMQLYAGLLPIAVGAMLSDDWGYVFLCLTVPALIFGLVALVDEINQQIFELYASQLELAKLSNTDYLTKIPNRRYFGGHLESAMQDCRISREPLSVFMIDVDYFKGYNDCYGHVAGDECLRRIAEILQANIRDTRDTVSRYGGEEFAVVLKNTAVAEARFIAERLRAAVAEARLAHLNRRDGVKVVTISIGAATSYMPGNDAKRLTEFADKALYEAKGAGRNRIALVNADLSQLVASGA